MNYTIDPSDYSLSFLLLFFPFFFILLFSSFSALPSLPPFVSRSQAYRKEYFHWWKWSSIRVNSIMMARPWRGKTRPLKVKLASFRFARVTQPTGYRIIVGVLNRWSRCYVAAFCLYQDTSVFLEVEFFYRPTEDSVSTQRPFFRNGEFYCHIFMSIIF